MISQKLMYSSLSCPVDLDKYLIEVSRRFPSHRFLSGATQGCYLRMTKFLVNIVRSQQKTPSNVRILDWGTGKGQISYLLKAVGFDVTSCDLKTSSDDSSFGQETPIITENQIDVVPLLHPWKLPFENAEFDIVVSFGVLEHVSNDYESLKEIRRILTSGGIFFFSFLPYWLSWTQRLAYLRGDRYHPRLYRLSFLEEMAKKVGFGVDAIWHGQLLPKNSFPHNNTLERLDRYLTTATPLKYFATNLEGVLIAK
jgi:SAM-dependent methyltransferase